VAGRRPAIPDYALLTADSDFDDIEEELGLPLFVKPAREGSSIGVTKVKERGGLKAAYEEAARHDPLVIAEKGVLGGEYTVGIIGDEALPSSRSSRLPTGTTTRPNTTAMTPVICAPAVCRKPRSLKSARAHWKPFVFWAGGVGGASIF
jgi:hypothetical protein